MVTINLGETRQINCTVSIPGSSAAFTIRNAEYTIKEVRSPESVSGACDIDGHELTFMYTPESEGTYILTYTFDIGEEHIIKKDKILVM